MKLLVITGAGSGIGYQMSKKFFRKFYILGISKFTNQRKNFSHIHKKIKIDINNHKIVKKKLKEFIKENKNEIKEINFLFCASIIGNSSKTLEDQLRNWELVFKTNIVSNLLILQHFKIILSKIRTRIIFFAGGGAAYEYPLFPSYAVSKISSVKIVENLEEDYKNNRDFIIIALSPGSQKTNMQNIVLKYGGKIKTRSNMNDLFYFISDFLNSNNKKLSGRFFHVNEKINNIKNINKNRFKLRRILR